MMRRGRMKAFPVAAARKRGGARRHRTGVETSATRSIGSSHAQEEAGLRAEGGGTWAAEKSSSALGSSGLVAVCALASGSAPAGTDRGACTGAAVREWGAVRDWGAAREERAGRQAGAGASAATAEGTAAAAGGKARRKALDHVSKLEASANPP